MKVRRRLIRNLTENILGDAGVQSAPIDVEKIANQLGIEVQHEVVENSFSGFILKNSQSKKTVIGVNSSHPPKRKRFTIAHELGHFFLHVHGNLRVDQGLIVIRNRDAASSAGTDTEEVEANFFAAELLMPTKFLIKDLTDGIGSGERDDEFIRNLANKYDVSEAAMAIRLSSLGYLPM